MNTFGRVPFTGVLEIKLNLSKVMFQKTFLLF